MSEQAKPIRLTVKNRIELVNQILVGLYSPKIEALAADMKAAAQSIVDSRNTRFLELYADKANRTLLDYSRDKQFTYLRPLPPLEGGAARQESAYLIVPAICDESRRISNATYATLSAEDPGYSSRRDDRGERITVMAPNRGETIRLTANEKRKVESLERRVRKLIKEFDDVKEQLIGAVHVAKTVIEFYTTYPELRPFCKVAEYDAYVPRTNLVVVPGQLLRQIRSLGLLPKAETQQLAA